MGRLESAWWIDWGVVVRKEVVVVVEVMWCDAEPSQSGIAQQHPFALSLLLKGSQYLGRIFHRVRLS